MRKKRVGDEKASKYLLVSGGGDGHSKLNAFDKALLSAGVGNMNLLRVTSILPPNSKRVSREELELGDGSLLWVAYASVVSKEGGEVLLSGVGVGIPEDIKQAGVIMEHTLSFRVGSAEINAEEQRLRGELGLMLEEAFMARGYRLGLKEYATSMHVVEEVGCSFAGVVLWV